MGTRQSIVAGLGLSAIILAGCAPATPTGPAASSGSTGQPALSATAQTTTVPSVGPASGIVLELAAQQPAGKDVGWDVWELSAPADKSFDVAYTNDDKARHDFAVLPEAAFVSDIIFKSEMVQAFESATITVPALPAGTYDFVCSLHSTEMRGSLTVE